jgi:N-acetylneuraminate synthase
MVAMHQRYGTAVGLSDHTLDNYAPFAAVALGASVVEKHLSFSRRMYGSDAKHSLEPDEFQDMVRGIRAIETMLSSPVDKDDLSRLGTMKEIFQKSVTTRREIAAGTTITRDMLGIRKPGTGVPAARLDQIVGRKATRSIPADHVIRWNDIEPLEGSPAIRAGRKSHA